MFIQVLFLSLLGCNEDDKNIVVGGSLNEEISQTSIKYAERFSIRTYDDYKVIQINEAWKDVEETYRYVLYKNKKPLDVKDAVFIKIPITTIACLSLTHVAFLERLGVENSIVGISGCSYVSSPKINARIKNNKIKEIGQQQGFNYEVLIEQSPEIVMAYGIDGSSNGSLKKMEDLGLDVVLNSEYMETHPLGKAEWVKFVAAFYDKSEEAESIFNHIEKEYLDLIALTKLSKVKKPTVFTGMPWNGSWYVPGAKSFQAKLFKDAGAQYLWLDNDEKSSLIKAKEVIIDEAYAADFWLNLNSYENITDVVGFDPNFKSFNAVQNKKMYNNNKRVNANAGNDYWESGVINPHLVLKDLIKIFHPLLIKDDFYYYQKME